MREIHNTQTRPIRVPLPGGKLLHLSPGKTAQISDRALEHPGVQSLIDEGVIELMGKGERGEGFAATTADAAAHTHGHARSSFNRRLSDR